MECRMSESFTFETISFFGRRTMMKKVLIVFAVLAMASVANAGLLISVDGRINPPDTEIILKPSEHAVIDIRGDGLTDPYSFALGVKAGDTGVVAVVAETVMLYPGSEAAIFMMDDPGLAGFLGVNNPLVFMEMTDLAVPPAALNGLLVDKIDFHCVAEGDVTLMLFDLDGNLLDIQVIHQIPEPITFALLGLGGLFLRRRK